MQIKKIYIAIVVVLSGFLNGCLDDDSGNIPIHQIVPASEFDFKNLQTSTLNSLVQNFSFDIQESDVMTFTSEKGVVVTVYGSCIVVEDEEEQGEVTISFIELFDNAKLLCTDIATMGKHPDDSLEILKSGGAFYLKVYINGEEIPEDGICNYTMQIPSALTGGTDYQMSAWTGDFNENGNLVWTEMNEEGEQNGGLEMTDDNYYFWTSFFGWTNVDRFYNDPRPKTTILVDVPDGYNASNSAVYLAYVGDDTGLARLDTFENGLFSEHYGLIPIGLECHVIFVSEFNGNWVYSIKTVTISEGEIIEILYEELNTATQNQLIEIIEGLP
jgi:hypothetical protein